MISKKSNLRKNYPLLNLFLWNAYSFCKHFRRNTRKLSLFKQMQTLFWVYRPNTLINSKLQHPPRAILRAFELLNIGSFKFPSPRAKVVFKCPTQYWAILSVINKCCKIKGSIGKVTYQLLVLLLGFSLLIIIPGWEICLLKPFIHIFSSIIHQH